MNPATAPSGSERRGHASCASACDKHITFDLADFGKIRYPHNRHGGVAVGRHPHDVHQSIETAIHGFAICQRAIVLGSQSAICGKAITSPSTTICKIRYGQTDPKIWLSVMPGGVTPLR